MGFFIQQFYELARQDHFGFFSALNLKNLTSLSTAPGASLTIAGQVVFFGKKHNK